MKTYRVIKTFGVIFAAFVISGCAAGQDQRDRLVKDLESQVASMKVSLAEANSRLDELGNKFSLLHEKVQKGAAQSEARAAQLAAADNTEKNRLAYVEEFAAPSGLKVESLGEEDAQAKAPVKENIKKAGKAKKDNAVKKKSATVASADEPLDDGAAVPVNPDKPDKPDKPESIYSQAQDLFLAGRFDDARGGFEMLISRFPKHQLAVNALYWTGETYYSEKNFEKALAEFIAVVEKYPNSAKAPDALLKAGYSYLELDKKDKARDSLEGLVKRYPRSEASAKAKKTLEKISSAKKEGSK